MAIAILQGIGGKVPQEKSIKIERDGNYTVAADEGFALETVAIEVDTPDKKPEVELDLGEITTNGVQEHIPPEGSVYSKVSFNVKIPRGTEQFDDRLDGIIALQNGYIGGGYKPSEGLEYSIDGSYAAVQYIGSCTDEVVVISAEYMTHPVAAIYNLYSTSMKELILPDSVSWIASTVNGCTALERVVFGANLNSIQYWAFEGNVNCKVYDFSRCLQIPTIDLYDDPMYSVFSDMPDDCKMLVPAHLLDDWKRATNWTMFADHIVAAESVADNGTAPTFDTTEERLEAIEGNVSKVYEAGQDEYKEYKVDLAALIDRSITEIEIPEGVTKIGDYCFLLCSGLKKITIPNTVTHIGGYALGFNALTSLDIPDSVIELGSNTIYNSPLNSITFGKNLSKISENNFNSMRNCVSYDFSRCEQVPQMTGDCFKNINSEAKIYVPSALYDEWIAATNWVTYKDYIVAK